MLLYKYMPDCCDQCCDIEKPDPQKDKVLIGKVFGKDAQIAPTAPEDKVFTKEPFGKEPAKLKELTEATRIIQDAHEAALLQRRQKEQKDLREIREMQKAQEVADAAAAREVVEAQELSDAFEASLREYDTQTKGQRERDVEDGKRYEQERAQRRKEEQEDQEKLDAFLKKNKFSDIHYQKKTLFSASYPLHCAVSKNDPEMVQLLLAAGAAPLDKNSSGLSPLALAQKLDKKASHSQILKLLRFGADS